MFKKIVSILLAMTALFCSISAFAYESVKMYAPDGRTEYVPPKDIEAWKSVGWYDYPVTTMYAPDGRSAVVATNDVESWKNVGWYNYPVITMYALDGRSAVVATYDVEAWKSVGWYITPVRKVYAPDGRSNIVAVSDVEAWKSVGWYDYPVTTMYALDGRSAVVATNDVEAWKSVGWYDFPVNAPDVFFDKVIMLEGMYEYESYVRHNSKLGFSLEYPAYYKRTYTDDTMLINFGDPYLKIKMYRNRTMESVRKELIGNLKLTASEYEIDGQKVYTTTRHSGSHYHTDIYDYYFVYNGDILYVITTYLPTIEHVEGIGTIFSIAINTLDFF